MLACAARGARWPVAAALVWALAWIVVGRTTDAPESAATAVAAGDRRSGRPRGDGSATRGSDAHDGGLTHVDTDVVVIGAGLAGLACAGALTGSGLDVLVLEAGDAVGGRVRTDRVDGFLLDRGFQLLNPAYPAVRRLVDLPALGLQPFAAGVAVRRADGPAGWSPTRDGRRGGCPRRCAAGSCDRASWPPSPAGRRPS